MAKLLRGDIVWADLDPTKGNEQAGKRPVLIVSHDIFNERSRTVIAVALTSQPQKAGFPLTLQIKGKGSLKSSWVKISQIRTLSVEKILNKICRITDDELQQVIIGLNEIIN